MSDKKRGSVAVFAACIAIFWPGAFVFSFPGVMAAHWQNIMGVNRAAIGGILFFVLAAVGLFMFITGKLQEKFGPSRLVAWGAMICGVSTILVGYAYHIGHIYIWAFSMGVASSLIYIPTLTVAQRWYPSKRGLVSGWVNLSFGFSGAVMSPLFAKLLDMLSYRDMTLLLGFLSAGLVFLSSFMLRLPEPLSSSTNQRPSKDLMRGERLSIYEPLKSKVFWLIWGTWAMAGAGGITMVTLSTSFGLSKGLRLDEAVLMLTAFNVTNGVSRLVSGYLSDFIPRNRTMAFSFLAAAFGYWLLGHIDGIVWWVLIASVVGFAFGTLFAVSAPLVVDCFGMANFGTVFGMIFTAYGFLAGVLGPWLSGYLLDISQGNFMWVFSYLGCFFLFSSILIWAVGKKPKAVN